MPRRFDHIDLRVPSLAAARTFYEALLPALGFTRNDSNERWIEFEHATEGEVTDYFAVTESKSHRPNENRIAFWSSSIAEVDRLSTLLPSIDARNVEGPSFEAAHYYAVYFEDPFGNRFEICHRTSN